MEGHSFKELYSNMKVKNGTRPVRRVGQNIQKKVLSLTTCSIKSHNLSSTVLPTMKCQHRVLYTRGPQPLGGGPILGCRPIPGCGLLGTGPHNRR